MLRCLPIRVPGGYLTALPHLIRPAEMGDRGYIVQTWLESYRPSPWAQQLPDFGYWSHFGHVGLVEALMDRSHVLVACLPERPSWIYGWLAGDHDDLNYAFVRLEFRRQGIGRVLYEAMGKPKTITHVTPEGSQWLSKMGVKPMFLNPYREGR